MPSPIDLKLIEHHVNLTRRARATLAHHRFDPHLSQPVFADMALPKFSRRAEGCRVWDILGREFIDWTGGVDSNLFGHRHPVVVDAIKKWAIDEPEHELDPPANSDGPFTDPKELLLAEQFQRIFGDDTLVGFTRGRNEAIYSATEIAKTQTGRPKIAANEVHSTRSLFVEDQRFRFARSHCEQENFRQIPLDDLKALQWLLNSNRDQFAALFVNPFAFDYPSVDYFAKVRQLLDEHGVLLILDESDTAFRLDLAGAQKHLSIRPDISIVGEKLGGPFAFSALVGKSSILSKAWKSTLKTVDRPAGLTLDVVTTAFEEVISTELPSKLNHIGRQLQEDINDFADDAELPFRLIGHPTRMTLQCDPHNYLTAEQIRASFCVAALNVGVVTHGEFWPNAAHDNQSLLKTIRALGEAMKVTSKWIDSLSRSGQTAAQSHSLHGTGEIRGRIDALNMIRKTMHLVGWILVDGQTVQLSATNESGEMIEAEIVHRGDLEVYMPDVRDAAKAGFRLKLEVDSIKKPSRFLIEGRQNETLVYQAFFHYDPAKNSSGPYPFAEGYLFA